MIIGLENAALLPAAWHQQNAAQSVRAFNPSLVADPNGWLFAYRIVTEPGLARRIALCRLDRQFGVIEGSQLPFSDHIQFAESGDYPEQVRTWFADPRLYTLQGRLFVYWNSGWHEPRNHQFLQEIEPGSLRPLGSPRELVLAGARQKLEKNWALFQHADQVYAVYSVTPYRILRIELAGGGPIQCHEVAGPVPNRVGFAQAHGGLRGGAPPQRLERHFYSFCHSIEDDPGGYRYVVSAYRFQAEPPFAPTDMPRAALPIAIPPSLRRGLPKLNPAVGDVLYPAGAAYSNGSWVLSIGVDDERCAIAVLSAEDVLRTLQPTAPASVG